MHNNAKTESSDQQSDLVLRTIFLPKTLDIRLREEASAMEVSKDELIRMLIEDNIGALRTSPGVSL